MAKSEAKGCVLFVSPAPSLSTPASGDGTRLKHLSRGLVERGWDVLGLMPEGAADAPDWFWRVCTYDQWSLPFLMDLNPGYVSALARVLCAEDVDVVHTSKGSVPRGRCRRW